MHNFQHCFLNTYCGVDRLTIAFFSFDRAVVAAINRAAIGMVGALLCTVAADQPMSAMGAVQQARKQCCTVHAGFGGCILSRSIFFLLCRLKAFARHAPRLRVLGKLHFFI